MNRVTLLFILIAVAEILWLVNTVLDWIKSKSEVNAKLQLARQICRLVNRLDSFYYCGKVYPDAKEDDSESDKESEE